MVARFLRESIEYRDTSKNLFDFSNRRSYVIYKLIQDLKKSIVSADQFTLLSSVYIYTVTT